MKTPNSHGTQVFSLVGKTALVTGSGRGIGNGILRVLAEAGADVVMNDVHRPDDVDTQLAEITSGGCQASFIQADVTDEQERQRLIDETVEKRGRLDILVNNAGNFFDRGWESLNEETIRRTLELNVIAMLVMSRLAIDHMRGAGHGGSIVNLSSVNGLVAEPSSVCYDTSKGAIMMMSKSLAVETFRDNINVNVLCPGIVDTPLFRDLLESEEVGKAIEQGIPCGRICTPRECGYPVLYMVSEEGRYMTGQHIILDGGILAVQATAMGTRNDALGV